MYFLPQYATSIQQMYTSDRKGSPNFEKWHLFWVPGGDISLNCLAMKHDFISVLLGNIILPEGPLYVSKNAVQDTGSATVRLDHFYFSEITNAHRYTGCPRRNGQNFGRVFLMLNYTDITQNTYIQS